MSGAAAPPLVLCSSLDEHGVATLSFNDPGRMNALTVGMGQEFSAAVDALKVRGGLRAVVLRGEGGNFSAGGDLDWLEERCDVAREDPDSNVQTMRDFYGMFLTVRDLPVPVVAAMEGAAVGAGMCLAMACDLRVAQRSGRVGFTFTGLGLHPGMGATQYLRAAVGVENANRLMLTGRILSGEQAMSLGVVSELAEEGQVYGAAVALAREIAAQSPTAVRQTVATLRMQQDAMGLGREAALQREAEAQAVSYGGADMREGLRAVREKRRPNF